MFNKAVGVTYLRLRSGIAAFSTRRSRRDASSVQEPVGSDVFKNPLVILGGGYLALVNIASFGLFAYDKFQANRRGWRIPEKTLQMSALLGGWIGGMSAMQMFRHKTVKESFRTPYFLCTGLNVAILTGLLYGLRVSPSLRSSLLAQARQLGIKN